jgi:uncharacterized protein with von Willebrand factor type A (vWA) domain
MHLAWRHYRRMARSGPATELDAEATLERLCRDCALAEPVMVPRRANRARALILLDAGPSMTPFRYITRELVDSARRAGLERVDTRYYHESPRAIVFRDPRGLEPMTLDAAAAPFVDAGMLVYGEAGAARGVMDEASVNSACAAIETLRRFTPAIAWLNPVPRARWAGSSASAIRERTGIAMFELDRHGLSDAIDTMRGLVR